MIGITNSTLVTILGLAEIFFNSSFNFFLSNNVLSMDENTSTILPPVLFKIVSDDDKNTASSKSTLLANRSNTVSTDKPYYISRYIFLNSSLIGSGNSLAAIFKACKVLFPDLNALFITIIALNNSFSINFVCLL